MKLNSIALALVSAIALTACGGSGSNLSAVNNSDHADKSLNRGGSYNQGSYKQGSHSKDSHNQGSQSLGSQNQGSQNQGSQNQGSQNQGSQNQGSQNQGSQNQGSQNQGSQNQGSQNQGSQGQGSQGQGSQGQGSPTQQAQDDNPLSSGYFKDKTGDFSGAYINKKYEDGETDTIEPKGLTTVRINGDDFTLIPFYEEEGNSYMLGSGNYGETKLSSARYGIIYIDNGFIVAQGFATKKADVPTTGEAIYKGKAIYSADDKDHPLMVDSAFHVNFGDKKLVGVIGDQDNPKAFKPVDIQAEIDGNQFAGDYDGFRTQGQFYGVKAAELAGTFVKNDGTVSGAFGAKKVK